MAFNAKITLKKIIFFSRNIYRLHMFKKKDFKHVTEQFRNKCESHEFKTHTIDSCYTIFFLCKIYIF